MNYKIDETELLKAVKHYEGQISVPREPKLTDAETQLAMKTLTEELKLPSDKETLIVLTILFQKGGTARQCDGNLEAKIGDKTVKLAQIRSSLKNCRLPKSERKLARSVASILQQIAEVYNIPGNLASVISSRPDFEGQLNDKDKTWLSDFQSGNPDCPEKLRQYINKHFSNLTNKKKPKNQTNR